MKGLQVLVATINQRDFSLAKKMNLRCDAIIANQADFEDIATEQTDNRTWKMISTKTKGVGLNRNIALLAADHDIVLFADDDVVYKEDMPEKVLEAFRENEKADILIFGMDYVKNGEVFRKRHLKKKKLHIWNAMRFGAVSIAVKREALLKGNITFHQSFGGGCVYGSGEDTLFIRNCFDRKLQVYSHDYVLGICAKDGSTWFSGYNEKYFFDKGALLACAFPRAKHLLKWYFAWKFSKKTELPLSAVIEYMNWGVRAFRTHESFKEALSAK